MSDASMGNRVQALENRIKQLEVYAKRANELRAIQEQVDKLTKRVQMMDKRLNYHVDSKFAKVHRGPKG